jgi:DNA-binding SARP family transcriptional activator
MEFRILGPLEVVDEGRQVDFGGAKQRALLTIFLLHANEVVSTDRLIEALWEEEPPETAQKALQVYVSQLRKTLGKERLETKAPGYRLRVEEDELDLARFQRLAEEKPREALALWRGEPLAEFSYQRFAQAEIARLEELRLRCLEQRIDEDLAQGRHGPLISELERLVREHPLRERLRAQLMLALYRSGRQAEALEVYQVGRKSLSDELGLEPSHELRVLEKAILGHDPSLRLVFERAMSDEVVEGARGVFVGRDSELDALAGGLNDALAGRGRLFLLVGEPGIGKSRLADELIRRTRERGAHVLIGRCWEAGGAPAYWPWVQSLRSLTRATDAETMRPWLRVSAPELAQLLPELNEFLPDLVGPSALESGSARFRLFEAVSTFLKSAAQHRPLVLVLDDLHAADEPSLLLLQFLARELGESRLLVVGAYRNVDPTPAHPLTTAVTELAREPVTRSIVLAGLGKEDVARFIELTSGETASDEFVTAIHEETEGNPLFVGEIVRLLAAEGGFEASPAIRIAIPESVRDVILRRLRHLSEECNRVLVLASVLGREFGVEALARVARIEADGLLETLDEAMRAGVISDIPGSTDRLRFAHVLIRDTLYDALTSVRRVRLHRLAAEALEALYGEDEGPHLAELAHHAVAGSDFEKGLRYAQRAGDRALAVLAYEEAARLYETALEAHELSSPDDDEARCELLLLLGEAEARAGNGPGARSAFFDAAHLARRSHLNRELARAAAGYGGRLVFARAADDQRLVPLLEDGLAALGNEDIELRARLLARLAGALRDEHSRDRRDAVSREAVELARQSGSAVALAYALDGRAAAIVAPDSVDECLDLASELLVVAQKTGDRERLISAHFHRFIAKIQVGDVEGAKTELAAEREAASELRQPAQLWQVHSTQAMVALAEGEFSEAERLNSEALGYGERAQPGFAIPAFRLQRHMLCAFRGSVQEVESLVRNLVTEYPTRPAFRCALAHLELELGGAELAGQMLQQLTADECAALPFDLEWLYGMSLLAETCARLDDAETAAVLYRLLLPWSAFNAVDVPEGMRGSVARYLGLLASTIERVDKACCHFEDALQMNERMGARPWLAHSQDDYARTLLARGGPGDAEMAERLLEAALSMYRELGMRGPFERARTLARA